MKVVFHPEFITATSPLFGLEYDQFVRGCHLGVFPSYYEPWGYTPMECVVRGVPAITSDLSGFGAYVMEHFPDHDENGVYVARRRSVSFDVHGHPGGELAARAGQDEPPRAYPAPQRGRGPRRALRLVEHEPVLPRGPAAWRSTSSTPSSTSSAGRRIRRCAGPDREARRTDRGKRAIRRPCRPRSRDWIRSIVRIHPAKIVFH